MRNCFVPNCDNFCNKSKRTMFLPPKSEELFTIWKARLPKKRLFKPQDKVCSRHFLQADIITTFDYIIEGKLCQMERERPRLKPEAIPCLNLKPEQNCHDSKKIKNSGRNKYSLNERLDQSPVIMPEEPIVLSEEEKDKKEEIVVKNDTNHLENKFELNLNFDALYDDVFEVVLPNTLWGVHRDTDRNFIAFTYFDAKSNSITKSILLTKEGVLKLLLSNVVLNTIDITSKFSHEDLSNILSEFDERNE